MSIEQMFVWQIFMVKCLSQNVCHKMSVSQMSFSRTSVSETNVCPPCLTLIVVGQPHFVGKVFSTERWGAKLSTYFNHFFRDIAPPQPCTFNNPIFIIISSVASFYVPCAILIILYTIIFKVSATAFCQRDTLSMCHFVNLSIY
jgi:hypothetical protein